jgi:hypothetical protein
MEEGIGWPSSAGLYSTNGIFSPSFLKVKKPLAKQLYGHSRFLELPKTGDNESGCGS